jgi:hypothetical protein
MIVAVDIERPPVGRFSLIYDTYLGAVNKKIMPDKVKMGHLRV